MDPDPAGAKSSFLLAILRSPVVNFAGGGTLKRTVASAWVHTALVLMRGAGIIRFALHPCDLERKEAVLKVLGALLAYRSSAPSRPARPSGFEPGDI